MSTTDSGWGCNPGPICPICDRSLAEHWRCRPCLPGPISDSFTGSILETASGIVEHLRLLDMEFGDSQRMTGQIGVLA